MHASTRLALSFALRPAARATWIVGSIVGGVACTSDVDRAPVAMDAGLGREPADVGNGVLQFQYNAFYSAFVEGHEARFPVVLKELSLRGKGARFRSSDPAVAVVEETAEGAIVTVKGDGVCVISAEVEGDTANAKLRIKKFSEAQWQAGQARYAKNELAIVPLDGGVISVIALTTPNGRNPDGACNTCHGTDAKTLRFQVTPTQVAGYSDNQLVDVFTKGQKPEGWPQKTQIPALAWGMFHVWTVTEEEKLGLVAYLRTLPPKPNYTDAEIGLRPCPDGVSPSSGLCNTERWPIPNRTGDGGIDAGGARLMIGEAGTGVPSDAGTPTEGG